MGIIAQKLEEQWTPTTIQAAFIITRSTFKSNASKSYRMSVDLPLLNIGWTFSLSFVSKKYWSVSDKMRWSPTALSFRRHGRTIPWGSTSMHATLSLVMEQGDRSGLEGPTPDDNNIGTNSTPLCTMDVELAQTSSKEVPLENSCAPSFPWRAKISLIVTISDCPFVDGLFTATFSQFDDPEAQARLATQSGDRVLSRSLRTGELFNVKFLTRSTPGNTGKSLETYVSLPVLEEHINLSSAKLKEEWASMLGPLRRHDNTDSKYIGEISCPKGCEYELDSDFEDEDESSDHVELGPCASSSPDGDNSTVLKGQQLESKTESTERSSSSLSSYDLGGASDQDFLDNLHEEVIKGPGESPHSSPVFVTNHKRAIWVNFAAHRTWYAFVWYCYTGRLNFSKLKSQMEPGTRSLPATHLEDGAPSCSPKSMYRLADLVDDKTLMTKALEAIRERLTAINVLDETFSVFTSKYPDVQEVQLDVLMIYWKSSEVKTAFLKTMSKFNSMPHAEPVLSAFYDRLAR